MTNEQIEAYERFCEMAQEQTLSPMQVVQLGTRGLLVASDNKRLREALRNIAESKNHPVDTEKARTALQEASDESTI